MCHLSRMHTRHNPPCRPTSKRRNHCLTTILSRVCTPRLFTTPSALFTLMPQAHAQIEIWEAVLTFIFFPILVGVAFFIDKGYHLQLGKNRISPADSSGIPGAGWLTRGTKMGVTEAVSLVKAFRSQADNDIADDELAGLIHALKPKTRAQERKEAMKFRKESTSGVPQEVRRCECMAGIAGAAVWRICHLGLSFLVVYFGGIYYETLLSRQSIVAKFSNCFFYGLLSGYRTCSCFRL